MTASGPCYPRRVSRESEPKANQAPVDQSAPYNPGELFDTTAEYYSRYRVAYPDQMFEHLRARLSLDGSQVVLDLGCGTGLFTIPLSRHVQSVIAVDPEPSMLAEGARWARDAGRRNIDWRRGDSYGLAEMALPKLDLTVIAAAFHWMDRAEVLRVLDELTREDGAVVVATGGVAGAEKGPWDHVIADVRKKYLGPHRRAGKGLHLPDPVPVESILDDSPFSGVEEATWEWEYERDLDSLIGLQFSLSWSTPAQFRDDDHRRAFEQEVRRVLSDEFPSGRFVQKITSRALIAHRP